MQEQLPVETQQSDARPPAPSLANKLFKPIERFFHIEASSGIVLLVVTAAALFWANSPWATGYDSLWHTPVSFGIAGYVWHGTVHFIVNDGLMTVFFLVVGLEIRREIHDGALADVQRAVVPLIAALGGIVLPALIYLSLTGGDEYLRRGWAVPTATDIAFAIGVLTVLGKRVPPAIRVLLLALAIIDDVAAILIIAFFYSSGIQLTGLAVAMLGVMLVFVFQRLGARSAWAYVFPGAVLWVGLLQAGVHPTLSGVILGLLTPAVVPTARERLFSAAARALEELRELWGGEPRSHNAARPFMQLRDVQRDLLPPVERVQLRLHPWVAFGIMPLFAFANAGVNLSGLSFESDASLRLTLAVVLALLLGKPLGIVTFTWLLAKTRGGALPQGMSWRGVWVIGCLGGIGFTMSLFMANLAFTDGATLAMTKFAVLTASVLAGIAGFTIGRWLLPTPGAQQR